MKLYDCPFSASGVCSPECALCFDNVCAFTMIAYVVAKYGDTRVKESTEPTQGVLEFDPEPVPDPAKPVTRKQKYNAVDAWARAKSASEFVGQLTDIVYRDYLDDVKAGKTPDVGAGQLLVTHRVKKAHCLDARPVREGAHAYIFCECDR